MVLEFWAETELVLGHYMGELTAQLGAMKSFKTAPYLSVQVFETCFTSHSQILMIPWLFFPLLTVIKSAWSTTASSNAGDAVFATDGILSPDSAQIWTPSSTSLEWVQVDLTTVSNIQKVSLLDHSRAYYAKRYWQIVIASSSWQ